eukprot:CAMPEP_0170603426 /NCGR_PEP_ID=MMETSP0224-20130122/18906_1 /TAXON_ID=285029 /ORGANISM="Togula jolla, Strain CCCM 725" /LENGTH=741 /DNA_ID=CAMNT_0010928307 /DNA_START=73 /DNA_END=2298 /DNA_ORIENTATION=+
MESTAERPLLQKDIDTCDESTACASSAERLDVASSTSAEHCHEEVSQNGVSILCVGVMRTGLKTLNKALSTLGYSDIYDQDDMVSDYELWNNVLRNRASPETFATLFRGKQVVMGMPTFCFWEEILKVNPNAKVILTVRDEAEWWESVLRAQALMNNSLPGTPLRHGSVMRAIEGFLVPSYHKFCEVLRFAWATTLGAQALDGSGINESAARAGYRMHNTYVRSTLENRTMKGGPQLLVYDVREGWGPLCAFLGMDEPEKAFPSVMKVPYFQEASLQGPSDDLGQEFEDILVPDSRFGMQMRQELRRGLAFALLGLTVLMAAVAGMHAAQVARFPVMGLSLSYLALVAVGWNVYGVMHGLVMRVPALVVLPMVMKSLLIAGALHACFLSYGILQEMLVTKDHIASPLLVVWSRFTSVVCSGAVLLLTDHRRCFELPLREMCAFAFTNEASTWCGYEMLKYVSFPVQVMAKSIKMLPSMIMGRLLNGTRYSTYQYVQALCALVCVVVMQLSEETQDSKPGSQGKAAKVVQAEAIDAGYKAAMGFTILILFFACDSFTSQWQTALYKRHPNLTQTQMMLGGNLLGFTFSFFTVIGAWSRISDSIGVLAARPEVMGRLIALGVVSALGQFCIYSAIRILGALSFTWIMTARQLLSVLISLVFFGHGINVTKLLCILVVFGVMSSKQLAKAVPRTLSLRCRQRSGGSVSEVSVSRVGFFRRPLSRRGATCFLEPKLSEDLRQKKE